MSTWTTGEEGLRARGLETVARGFRGSAAGATERLDGRAPRGWRAGCSSACLCMAGLGWLAIYEDDGSVKSS